MISYRHQFLDQKDIAAVVGALNSDWLTQGPRVGRFEQALAKSCGAKYAVVVSNGTAALHLAYLAAGLGPGDEAITTPNTFVATANMILAVGAKPVFCDIRKDSYNIDETKIEPLINEKTKVVVPVHFAGQPCEMKNINETAKKYKLVVIEDACHALGAEYQNFKIGSCRFSDMAVFSFHPVKSITTGEGGAILTNNRQYYDKIKLLRSHGIKKDKDGFNQMVELGYNYRMTDFQAALGMSQLKKLKRFIRIRRELTAFYDELLNDCGQIILPMESEGTRSSWHLYVIRTKQAKDRLPLYEFLLKNGVGVNFHYLSVYNHPFYKKNNIDGRCLFSELYEKTAITMPLHPQLARHEIKFISSIIKRFFQKNERD